MSTPFSLRFRVSLRRWSERGVRDVLGSSQEEVDENLGFRIEVESTESGKVLFGETLGEKRRTV